MDVLQFRSPDLRTPLLKTARECMNIIDAFGQLGSYGAAARLCGTTDKTVKRAVQRQQAGGPWQRRPRLLAKNTDTVMAGIWERVRENGGRISPKRLPPPGRATRYEGSARHFPRAAPNRGGE